MTHGLSRSQVDALGNRLRHQGEPSEEDLLTLQAVRAGYDAPIYSCRVTYFLIVYDKGAGAIVDRAEFDDRELALAARFERERRERHRPGLEIVLLNAASEDDLRATHGRYFKTPAELTASIGRGLSTLLDQG